MGSTAIHPRDLPTSIRLRDGWSAGLASVGTLSMYKLTLTSKANFQNALTAVHKDLRTKSSLWPAHPEQARSRPSGKTMSRRAASQMSWALPRLRTIQPSRSVIFWVHLSKSFWSTSQPNCNGTWPFLNRTPPIHGRSGEPGLPSG